MMPKLFNMLFNKNEDEASVKLEATTTADPPAGVGVDDLEGENKENGVTKCETSGRTKGEPNANVTQAKKEEKGNGGGDSDSDSRLRFSFLKGYPPWPCEVIPRSHVKEVFPSSIAERAPGKSDTYLPVQYFGTMDYGWVKEKSTKSLGDLDETKVRGRNLKNQRYQRAVEQAYRMQSQPKTKPIGWWNGPKPAPPPPPPEREATKKRKERGEDAKSDEKKIRRERNAPNKGKATRCENLTWPEPAVLWHPHKPSPFRLPEMLEIRAKPRYESIRRNLYLGPEHGSHLKPKKFPKEDIMVCMCSAGTGCGSSCVVEQESCINKRMFMRCCHTMCPCGKQCQNKEFNLMKLPKLKAFLTDSCGWGVKTKEKIRKGQFVIEYVGEILSDAECEKRMWAAKARHERNFYMMEISSDKVIDARHKANLARLINSSCQPNCKAQKCVDSGTGEVRVGIFAIRDIEVNEELNYNYHFQHFADQDDKKELTSFDCRCGAPGCIGTLDSTIQKKEEVKKNINRAIKIKWKDGKMYNAKITDYSWKTQKYLIDYETGGQEEIALDQKKVKFKFVKKAK
jgi:hypothetical protein